MKGRVDLGTTVSDGAQPMPKTVVNRSIAVAINSDAYDGILSWDFSHGSRTRAPVKVKGSPYSITERRVPELIPVLGS